MSLEQDFFNIGSWLSVKFTLHKNAQNIAVKRKQILLGEIWKCDLGYNIGEEKNSARPVLVISNNKINRTGKVIALCITKANGKINQFNLPQHNSWYLLYADTQDNNKMFSPGRKLPSSANVYAFLDYDSVVQCEEIRTVSKARLINKLGDIDPQDLERIKRKLKKVFDINY